MTNSISTAQDGLLLTIEEARRELRIGRSLLYRLIEQGKLKLIKIGRASRLRREDILRLARGEE
jgi:excisionase family DNA binding protein